MGGSRGTTESREAGSAGESPGEGRFAGARARRLRRALTAPALALSLLLAAGGGSAQAAKRVDHIFGKTIVASGKCTLVEPAGVAVNETSGDIYVVEKGEKHRVDRFSSTGECLGSWGVAGPEAIAVDNTNSVNKGDVYVSAAAEPESEEHVVVKKYDAEGHLLATLKKFKIDEEKPPDEEEFAEHGEILGLAISETGDLFVYVPELIYHFAPNAETGKQTFVESFEVSGNCSPLRGFAMTPDAETFYVGRERENHKEECEEADVMVKLNGAGETDTNPPGEPAFGAQLDNEETSFVGLNRLNGEVFFDNLSSVANFDASGAFIQRFGDEAGEALLHEGEGVGINGATGTVYVADALGEVVRVYVPKTGEEPPAEGEKAHELPDHRAWEVVSPQNKFGASIFGITLEHGVVEASEDGNSVTYAASAPIVATPPSSRSPEPSPTLSTRSSGGWSTDSLATPRSEIPIGYRADSGNEYRYFTPTLSVGFLEPDIGAPEPHELALSPEATETTLYRRDTTRSSTSCLPVPSSCYQALVSPANDLTHAEFGAKLGFLSATADGAHAVLRADPTLLPEATVERSLYEWTASTGALQLVNILPEGEAGEATEAKLGARGPQDGVTRHAISEDGNRIVFSAQEEKLYMRDMGQGKTLRIDKPESGLPEPEFGAATFVLASADGSKVFFTDSQPLTSDATTSTETEEAEGQGDLYVCEVFETAGELGCHLHNLTAKPNAANENAAVQGVIGASEDGSYVYFVADAAYGPKAGRGHCTFRTPVELEQEQEGLLPVRSCSLYVVHLNAGKWEPPHYIATLTSEDTHTWEVITERGSLATVTSRVSPNGTWLAFMSNRSLTGYNNVDANPAAENGRGQPARDEEVFLYNTGTDKVQCASCNPTGAQPHGVKDVEDSGEGLGLVIDKPKNWEGRWLAANIPGWTPLEVERTLYDSRYLSDTGRLFFNSADGLVSADTNGKADVYEFEPNGEGTCASSTGCVSLISGGESPNESAFLDASVGGGNVFFLTAARLEPARDIDTAFDIYDARVCTSESPCLNPPPAPPPPCEGEGCRPAVSSQPAAPAVPPSAGPGSGNVNIIEKRGVLGEKHKVKPLTNAQKLKKALAQCRKKKNKKKRKACERAVHKRYDPKKKKHHKKASAHRTSAHRARASR